MQKNTEQTNNLWSISSRETAIEQRFEGNCVADTVVVGGGFTGLSTALHCAQRGIDVHLLEAKQIGFGGSGRNCGLVNPALWLPPKVAQKRLGEIYGDRFLKRFNRGPDYVYSLVKKYQIECEAIRTGTIHAAHSVRGLRDLENRAVEWKRLKEPVDLIDKSTIAQLTGTNVYHGGLLDHRAGTINPMGYCRGLARAALQEGAHISTDTKVNAIIRDGSKWRVITSKGSLQANSVILCTNAYTGELWPKLNRTITLIHYFQLATKPLYKHAENILSGRQGLWDTRPIMFNFRRDAFDRLIIGSMGKLLGNENRGLSRRWANQQIKRLFPELGPVEFEKAWHGLIAMTPDHLPRIYRLADNVYTPIGYNGRGIATGTLMGQVMAELLDGGSTNDLPLPLSSLRPTRSSKTMAAFYQTAFAANQIWHSF